MRNILSFDSLLIHHFRFSYCIFMGKSQKLNMLSYPALASEWLSPAPVDILHQRTSSQGQSSGQTQQSDQNLTKTFFNRSTISNTAGQTRVFLCVRSMI